MENVGHPLHVPAEAEGTVALPSYFSSHPGSKYFFCALFSETFPTFLLMFCCLKSPPSIVLKSYLVFLCARKLWCVKFHSGISMALLAVSSMFMNQHYIFNRGLCTETHREQGCVLVGLWNVVTRGPLDPGRVSPLGAVTVFCHSVLQQLHVEHSCCKWRGSTELESV